MSVSLAEVPRRWVRWIGAGRVPVEVGFCRAGQRNQGANTPYGSCIATLPPEYCIVVKFLVRPRRLRAAIDVRASVTIEATGRSCWQQSQRLVGGRRLAHDAPAAEKRSTTNNNHSLDRCGQASTASTRAHKVLCCMAASGKEDGRFPRAERTTPWDLQHA